MSGRKPINGGKPTNTKGSPRRKRRSRARPPPAEIKVSTKRTLTKADATPSRKGAHGHRLCRWCGKEVFPPRKTYCSDACTHEWQLRSDNSYLRSQLFLRDKGICASCNLDTLTLRRRLYDLPEEDRVRVGEEYGYTPHSSRSLSLWEADHVVPVFRGGGLSGLSNFQTLCTPCHRKKTREDMKER